MHARWLEHGLPCKRGLATAWAISRLEAFLRCNNVSKVQYKLHFSILLATTLASRSSPSPHSVPAAASACRDRRVTHTHTHTLPVFLLSRTSKIASDSLRPASSYFVPLQSSNLICLYIYIYMCLQCVFVYVCVCVCVYIYKYIHIWRGHERQRI